MTQLYHMIKKINILFTFLVTFFLFLHCSNNPPQKLNIEENCFSKFEINAPTEEIIADLRNKYNDTCFAQALNHLVEEYYNSESLESCYSTAIIAHDFIKNSLDTNSVIYCDALYHLGLCNKKKNNYNKAFYFYEKSLEIEKGLPNVKVLNIALAYNGLAYTYQENGDLEKAKDYFEQAVNLVKKSDGYYPYHMTPFLYDLAKNFKLRNQTDQAINKFQDCLNYVSSIESDSIRNDKQIRQLEINSYQRLADIYLSKEEIDTAETFIHKALTIQDKFENVFEDYYTYQILGEISFDKQNFQDAVNYNKEAESLLLKEREGSTKNGQMARLLVQKTKILAEIEEKNDSAFYYMQKALQSLCILFKDDRISANPEVNDIFNKHTAVEILHHKATLLSDNFDKNNDPKLLSNIQDCYQLINDLIPLIRNGFKEEQSKFILSDKLVSIFENGIANSLKRYELTKNDEHLFDAYNYAAANKAAALQESIQYKKAETSNIIPKVDQEKLDQLKIELGYKKGQIYELLLTEDEENKSKVNTLQEEVIELNFELEKHLKKLKKNHPNYYFLRIKQQSTSVGEIQDFLDQNTLFLEYFKGEKNTYLFNISKNNIKVFTIPNTKELDINIVGLKKETQSRQAKYRSYINNAHTVFNKLVKQALESSANNIDHLIIIPDGNLNSLPFEALLMDKNELEANKKFSINNLSYLIEKYKISYNFSSTLMINAAQKEVEPTKESFLGICPVNDLEYSEKETDYIHSQLGGFVLKHQNATFKKVKELIGQYQIVHFATHAKPNKDNPNMSEIELYNNEKIKNFEIEALKLNAEIVVLSACETGIGQQLKGEGVMSLARSFQLAGSPATVASLWKVSDASTADLMKYFYGFLKKGETKSNALQMAKLKYLDDVKASPFKSQPYHWSAFIQIGKDDALSMFPALTEIK